MFIIFGAKTPPHELLRAQGRRRQGRELDARDGAGPLQLRQHGAVAGFDSTLPAAAARRDSSKGPYPSRAVAVRALPDARQPGKMAPRQGWSPRLGRAVARRG